MTDSLDSPGGLPPLTPQDVERETEWFRDLLAHVRSSVAEVIVGQEEAVRQSLVALAVGGHTLLESVPGLGKTELVKSIARALHLEFGRVQFTPDLMPADILGTNLIVDTPGGGKEFRYQPGPVFVNVLLADEINRATPKTQSALLEAMQERQVTSGGARRPLPDPFFVMATQNPLEQEGTYPLPEAQLDRFLFKVVVDYPSQDDLERIVVRTTTGQRAENRPVAMAEDLVRMRRLVREVPIAAEILRHAVAIVAASHPSSPMAPPVVKKYVRYGASPRAAQALVLGARASALIAGRPHVAFSDIHSVALPALRHRILLNFEGLADAVSTDQVVEEILRAVPR